MSHRRYFSAVLTETGIKFTEPKTVAPYLRGQFAAGEVFDAYFEEHKNQRSIDANSYFHAEPLVKWMKGESDFEGLSPAQAKLVLLGLYFGYEQTRPGVWLPVKSSTSELSKEEFTGFIEWLIAEGNARGINVCPPEQDPKRRDKRVRHDEASV